MGTVSLVAPCVCAVRRPTFLECLLGGCLSFTRLRVPGAPLWRQATPPWLGACWPPLARALGLVVSAAPLSAVPGASSFDLRSFDSLL